MGAWSDGARGGRERGCREGTYCDCGLLPWEYESLGDGVCCGLIADWGREEDACAYIALEGGVARNDLEQSQYVQTVRYKGVGESSKVRPATGESRSTARESRGKWWRMERTASSTASTLTAATGAQAPPLVLDDHLAPDDAQQGRSYVARDAR